MAKKYIFTGDKHQHLFPDGTRRDLKKGEAVELTEKQAKAFADKFKSEEDLRKEVEAAEAALKNAKALAEGGKEADKTKEPQPQKPAGQ